MRPSASALTISTCLPDRVRMISSGRRAFPEGMFSARARIPATLIGRRVSAAQRSSSSTTAAPAMSCFIPRMFGRVLRLSPPESNVIPLPATATGGAAGSLCPCQRRSTSRGGRSLPCPTPSSAPIPRRRSSLSSSTSTTSPRSRSCRAIAAMLSGYRTLGGSDTICLTRCDASTMRPCRSHRAARRSEPASSTNMRWGGHAFSGAR